ncbi:MAG: DegV family protein [Syntrophomonadaceae bacterium]|nr:DegV family protein [Syntrophomonadaceae bacterium]
MGIRIITDSTSYLPPEKLEEYEIEVVPLEITLGEIRFREGEMSNHEYYSRLRSTSDFPTTSQPPVGDFVKAFQKYGPEETYICIVISELLSGTFHAAENAAAMLPDYDITVLDSRSTAMGLGFQILKAAEMGRQGFARDQIIQELVKLRAEIKVRFVVDNLEYLVRGGRLSKAGGLVGNLLQVKPILGIIDGKIEALKKVRSKRRAVDTILEELKDEAENGRVSEVAICHVDAESEALEVKERIAAFFPKPILVSEVGPTIGSHTGPGVIGLVYY